MTRTDFIRHALFATLLAVSPVSVQADDPSIAADYSAWVEAYSAIKATEPKWAVQGVEAFKTSSDAGVPIVYLDVRTVEEQAQGYIDGATLVNLVSLPTPEGIARLPDDKSAIIAVYCKSGHRSSLALPFLYQLGYTNAIGMKGGYEAWVEMGYPVAGVPADAGSESGVEPSE